MLSMPRIVRPDPHRIRGRNLDPPLDRPLADPLSETKNWRNLLIGRRGSQVSHSLPAHLKRFIGDEAIPDSRLGLMRLGLADRFVISPFEKRLSVGKSFG